MRADSPGIVPARRHLESRGQGGNGAGLHPVGQEAEAVRIRRDNGRLDGAAAAGYSETGAGG